MDYTVNRPGGTKDTEFEADARLLLQTGADLGNSPRVLEPGTGNRWLFVWSAKDQAEDFARELRRRTRDDSWQVVPVDGAASQGPLGPVLIQLSRRSDSLVFALHPVSRAMLQTRFPQAQPEAGTVAVTAANWYQMLKLDMNLRDAVLRMVPARTGLTAEEFTGLGFAVIDDASGATLLHERPANVR